MDLTNYYVMKKYTDVYKEDEINVGRIVYFLSNLKIPSMHRIGRVFLPSAVSTSELHCHPGSCEIIFYHSGKQTYEVNEGFVEAKAGDLLFFFPDEIHGFNNLMEEKSNSFFLIFDLTLDTDSFLGMSREESQYIAELIFSLKNRIIHMTESTEVYRIFTSVMELYSSDNPLKASMIKSQLIKLFFIISETITKHSEFAEPVSPDIQTAIDFIEKSIHDNISTQMLAKMCSLSLSQFKQKFKSQLGVAPHEYILRRKLDLAENELKNTRKTITDIALNYSFSSGQHFSSTYKKYRGFSPKKIRQVLPR